MNNNSLICRFISEHENWRELFLSKNIAVKETGNLSIFNYGIDSDFQDPVVQEARGIIINTGSLDVVCWPFRKFGNYGEGYVDTIDWSTARVQEKIDGSIVKLWYDYAAQRWQWSTNSMIDAGEAHIVEGAVSFADLIRRADNYKDIPFDSLDTGKTYIFELVAPEQKIVIKYDYPYLYHIGTRSNISGLESNDDIGIKKPAEYPIKSLKECIAAAESLNMDSCDIKHEGFVVVDAGWHRIKVKSPEYVYAHHIATGHIYTKKRIMQMIRLRNVSLEELIKTAPDAEVYVRFYQWKYAELKKKIRIAISKARAMYEELEHDRKAVAGYLDNEPLQAFCFKALGNNRSSEDILAEAPGSRVFKLIPDYGIEGIGYDEARYIESMEKTEMQSPEVKMTQKVNVFNQTQRKIRCIAREHDYLGTGTMVVEEDLEVGKIYSFVRGRAEAYGSMVFLKEVPSRFGFQAYLFEEMEAYDEETVLKESRKWLMEQLDKDMDDAKKGRVYSREEMEKMLEELRRHEDFAPHYTERHDPGAAYWIYPVRAEDNGRTEIIEEYADLEISIPEKYFDWLLTDFFVNGIDSEMAMNLHRYSTDYVPEGMPIYGFAWDMNPNFYKKEDMERVIKNMWEASAVLRSGHIEKLPNRQKARLRKTFAMVDEDKSEMSYKDAMNLTADFYDLLASRLRRMMSDCPQADIICVMAP